MQDQIHVVLDSIASAEETPLKDDPRVHIMKLLVRLGDTEWEDGDKTLAEMFSLIDKTGKLPVTSQPPLGKMLELFTELTLKGKKLIVFTIDSVLSGTYQTACTAARQVMAEHKGADIRVIDSKAATSPVSSMAMEVLRQSDLGMGLDELEALANDMVKRTHMYFTVNTLEYLYKGGRIGAVGALLGSVLGIRPIVHIDREGRLELVDKCRTRKKVIRRLAEFAAAHAPVEAVMVGNAESLADCEKLKEEMEAVFPGVPVMLTGIGTVLASHLGPGALGVYVRCKGEGKV